MSGGDAVWQETEDERHVTLTRDWGWGLGVEQKRETLWPRRASVKRG